MSSGGASAGSGSGLPSEESLARLTSLAADIRSQCEDLKRTHVTASSADAKMAVSPEPRPSIGQREELAETEEIQEHAVVGEGEGSSSRPSTPPKAPPAAPTVVPSPPPLLSKGSGGAAGAPPVQAPRTGVTSAMMWPFPAFSRTSPSPPHPFHPVRPHITEEMQAYDAHRASDATNVINRVVYDSLLPPEHPDTVAAWVEGTQRATAEGRPLGMGDLESGPETLPPWYTVKAHDDRTLVFESRFETGNLRRAIQVYKYEYDLILKPDVNTRGHTQWFYFSVSNMVPDVKYKFNLINLLKNDSLYNHGMQPVVYSTKNADRRSVGWTRRGTDICYYQNAIRRKGGYYHTATFSMTFEHAHDTVYIAHCYPYTYTDLQEYLASLQADPKRAGRFRCRPLCRTLAGNSCPVLTVTSLACDPAALKARRGVVITARVHPGESNASWMMQGLIDYITGPSLDAKILRDNFVFKIVPMLNPDGVIVGNYRCSLAGVDLNRHWLNPDKRLHPTIWHTKQMIKRLMDDRQVVITVDLHGHSRKMNMFMYGCENPKDPSRRLKERVFPRMLWQNAAAFSYDDCNFTVQRSKESTARVVLWREFGLLNSFTLEASFAGANMGKRAGMQFTAQGFADIGRAFCDTLLDYCDPDQSKALGVLAELEAMHPQAESRYSSGSDSDSGEDGPGKSSSTGKGKKKKGKGGGSGGGGGGAAAGGGAGGRRRAAESKDTDGESKRKERGGGGGTRRVRSFSGKDDSKKSGSGSRGSNGKPPRLESKDGGGVSRQSSGKTGSKIRKTGSFKRGSSGRGKSSSIGKAASSGSASSSSSSVQPPPPSRTKSSGGGTASTKASIPTTTTTTTTTNKPSPRSPRRVPLSAAAAVLGLPDSELVDGAPIPLRSPSSADAPHGLQSKPRGRGKSDGGGSGSGSGSGSGNGSGRGGSGGGRKRMTALTKIGTLSKSADDPGKMEWVAAAPDPAPLSPSAYPRRAILRDTRVKPGWSASGNSPRGSAGSAASGGGSFEFRLETPSQQQQQHLLKQEGTGSVLSPSSHSTTAAPPPSFPRRTGSPRSAKLHSDRRNKPAAAAAAAADGPSASTTAPPDKPSSASSRIRATASFHGTTAGLSTNDAQPPAAAISRVSSSGRMLPRI